MSENVIFEQQIEGFQLTETSGMYFQYIIPPPFNLEVGKTYKVIWDSAEYEVVGQDANEFMAGAIVVGNCAQLGLVGNDEPFVIVSAESDVTFFSFDTKTSHAVVIYQAVEEEEEVGIVIKNYSGTPIEYKGVEKVMFNTADGGKRVYSKGEALEDVSIDLDFSSGDQTVKAAEGTLVKSAVIKKPETLVAENIKSGVSVAGVEGALIGDGEEVTVSLDMSDGDMVIEPTDGKLFSSVTVEKPDTLIPENIAEGVDIAGIIGTLVAGGGDGGDKKVAIGTYLGTQTEANTISHNLGVIPDLFFLTYISSSVPSGSIYVGYGMSSKLKNTYSAYRGIRVLYGSNGYKVYETSSTIEDTSSNKKIYNATENTIKVGNYEMQLGKNTEYLWIAIGGLT